jgi:dTDP-glucose 4,6-dehydratase
MPVLITRASNNYGPYQFPEKLIPLMITNAMEDHQLPVYGDGMQVRAWLYVDDHYRGILAATGKPDSLIRSVEDRPGHDRRYALSSVKIMRETGWCPTVGFEEGLMRTTEWYRHNSGWVSRVRRGISQLLRQQLR